MMSKIQIFESNSQRLIHIIWHTHCCLWCQRYKFLKAIHNWFSNFSKNGSAVYDVKDTNFWKQFTTCKGSIISITALFMMSKIQIFESNSQRIMRRQLKGESCLWCQRYKFLKAIHNLEGIFNFNSVAVYWLKDTNFWKQFTTNHGYTPFLGGCLWCQRYKFLKAIHNCWWVVVVKATAVYDVKDTNFWKQFTTSVLFTKNKNGCLWCQRYKFLKAIHNQK